MPTIKKELLTQGFDQAKRITREASANFYFVSLFLPKPQRLASYSVYALCRLSDETVDDDRSFKKQDLDQMKEKIHEAYQNPDISDPLLLAFRHTVYQYKIPQQYFDDLLEGMAMDLSIHRYRSFDDLYPYCYNVAGVVGLIQLKIFGSQDPSATHHAVDLGIALQLTNILRDVNEDFKRGRIYLPLDELKKHGVTEEDIQKALLTPQWKDLMRQQIKRARSYYAKGSLGLTMIKNTRCRLVAFLILHLYARILDKIESKDFDIFHQKAFVPLFEKIIIFIISIKRFLIHSLTFSK